MLEQLQQFSCVVSVGANCWSAGRAGCGVSVNAARGRLACVRPQRPTEGSGLGEEVELRLLGSTELAGLGEEVGLRLLGSTEVAGLGEEVELRLLG